MFDTIILTMFDVAIQYFFPIFVFQKRMVNSPTKRSSKSRRRRRRNTMSFGKNSPKPQRRLWMPAINASRPEA